jgi:hypothetical protein
VISANVARRHLNESQRGLAAAQLAQMPKGGDRRSKDFKGSNEPLMYTIDEVAKLFNVSRETVKRARAVLADGTDGLIDAAGNGDVQVGAAVKIAK